MSGPVEPIDEKGEYRGVEYTISGDYIDAEKTRGDFNWRCKYGFGKAGDPKTAREMYVQRIIDANLALEG